MKTLKDIKIDGSNGKLRLKANAIEWIKEDKKILKRISPSQYVVFEGLTNLWMKRLNISEEDLK